MYLSFVYIMESCHVFQSHQNQHLTLLVSFIWFIPPCAFSTHRIHSFAEEEHHDEDEEEHGHDDEDEDDHEDGKFQFRHNTRTRCIKFIFWWLG